MKVSAVCKRDKDNYVRGNYCCMSCPFSNMQENDDDTAHWYECIFEQGYCTSGIHPNFGDEITVVVKEADK